MNIDKINNYVKKWAPMIYLHPDERYMPATVDWYLQNVELSSDGSGSYSGPPVDVTNLPTASPAAYLKVRSNNTGSVYPGQLSAHTPVPAYAAFRKSKDGSGAYEIDYWFFYAFNGPAYICVEGDCHEAPPVGTHQGDWEHITVRINEDGSLIAVYYAQHSWGEWLLADNVPKTGSRQIIGYSAINTHATYPHLYTQPIPIATRSELIAKGGVFDRVGHGFAWDTSQADQHQLISVDVPGVSFTPTGSIKDWVDFPGTWGEPGDALGIQGIAVLPVPNNISPNSFTAPVFPPALAKWPVSR